MTIVIDGTTGISGVDGTASNPSYEGTDSNTGIFFPAADTVAIGTGGTERLRVDSSGNVGFGTNSPALPIDVVSNSSSLALSIRGRSSDDIGTLMYYTNNGVTNTAQIQMRPNDNEFRFAAVGARSQTFYTNGSERMRIDSSGNLLIGGTTANGRLDVAVPDGTTNALILERTGASPASLAVTFANQFSNLISSGVMTFWTGGSERARITSGGLVGIGIQSPGGTLDVNTSDNTINSIISRHSGASAGNLQAYSSNASLAGNVIESGAARSASSAYRFFAAYSGAFTDLEFNLRGDGNGYADGTWNNNGADYAEFFESATGAALTLGATVVLDGNKVREATDQDPVSAIMGVVRPKEPSKASMIVGNTAWNKWANKYLTDDFDRYIMEAHDVLEWIDEEGKQHSYESHNIPAEVTVPDDALVKTHDDKGNKFQHYKLNPAWNPDAEYVNRENRPEWIIVGLVGQVKILKGQPVNDRWIKMRDVSETVEEWMIR
jgi:hypothetical protein